jgi:hypothetical protein
MKKIIQYQLVNGTTPSYISNGGFFADHENIMQANIIGVSVEDETQLPEGYVEVNKAALTSLLSGLEMYKRSEDGIVFTVMNAQDRADYLDQWLTEVGFPNLQ